MFDVEIYTVFDEAGLHKQNNPKVYENLSEADVRELIESFEGVRYEGHLIFPDKSNQSTFIMLLGPGIVRKKAIVIKK